MKSKVVKIIIERSKDMYSSYAENVPGIYGGGNTVDDAKKSALAAIKLLKQHNEPKHVPAIVKGEFTIVYKYDTESFLKHFKGIFTNSCFGKNYRHQSKAISALCIRIEKTEAYSSEKNTGRIT